MWAPDRINTYADVRNNKTISSIYTSAMSSLGSPVKCDFGAPPIPGSTDQGRWLENTQPVIRGYHLTNIPLGNVSYECPAFRGYVGIPTKPGASNHTPKFTAHARTRVAHDVCLEAAKGMAIVGWKILSDQNTAEQVWDDFEKDKRNREQDVEIDKFGSLPGGGCC